MGKNGHGSAPLGGVDVGGTKLHAVVCRPDGKILARARKKTRASQGFRNVVERVKECLAEACAEAKVRMSDLAFIGVGAPSAIRADGTAVNAPNMGWREVPLGTELAKAFGRPVALGNDCDVGTLGEYVFGAGRGAKLLVGYFLGTGLGGGIVRRGEILKGENGLAAELGHMIVHVDGRECGCGHAGCLEAYASKTGIGKRLVREIRSLGRESVLAKEADLDLLNVRSGVLKEAYVAGDAVVREALDEAARYLGVGVGNAITILGPDVVVLGGGVFEALGKELIDAVRNSARLSTFPPRSFSDTRVVLSELGDDAVAVGATALAAGKALAPAAGR